MVKRNFVNKTMGVVVMLMILLFTTVNTYAEEPNWVYKNNTWYAIENEVLLRDTWVKHKEDYYYLNKEGRMLQDSLVDGHYIALDGRYVVMEDYDVECNKIIQILKSDSPNSAWEPVTKDASRVVSNLNNNRLFGNVRLVGQIFTDSNKRRIVNVESDIHVAIAQYDYVNTYLNEIVAPIIELTDKERVEYISNWITNRFEYSYSNLYSVYDAIILNETVCNGYAAIFKSMCNKAGVRCDIVTGTANNTLGIVSHALNKVYLEDKEYYFDLCWNDMLDENKYFFMSYDEIKVDHFKER